MKLKEEAKASQKQKNLYDWKFQYIPGKSCLEYRVDFQICGILHLYTQWNIKELTLSMCQLDAEMARMNHTDFLREGTLYDGNCVCDCHYIHHKDKKK